MANGERDERRRYPVLELEGLGSMEDVARELSEEEDDDDDDDTVDERAQKFIESCCLTSLVAGSFEICQLK
ncbi:hypothetical protein K7X08_031440 [Anisodus acutangulus]|uniref:Uncharacterized protein n=1 Tax=Anisodus acutangulus TaxID=402998 RepID=A0A9Q1MPP2_9SOLA|nr:hypothetical protein K7X08_031440 [Anisodus acutangulus]